MLPLDAMAGERGPTVLPARATQSGVAAPDCSRPTVRKASSSISIAPAIPSGPATSGPRSGIGAKDACAKLVPPSFEPAQWRAARPAGAFRDLGRGDCWSCPANWHRTVAPVDNPNACSSDLPGILGVSPRSICTDSLAAVEEGGAAIGRVQAAISNFVSPVAKRLDKTLSDMTRLAQTPAVFDRLLAGVDLTPTVNLAVIHDALRFADSAGNAVERLARAVLDPAVVCDGTLGRLNRELLALGLRPSRSRATRTERPVLPSAC